MKKNTSNQISPVQRPFPPSKPIKRPPNPKPIKKPKSLLEKATELDDSFAWGKILPRSKEADGYLIHATTLSVIQPQGQADGDARRVRCGVFFVDMRSGKSNYINVTARWDRDDSVRVCGYPQSWGLHDTDEPQEYEHEFPMFLTQYMEYVVISDLKRCVQNQFKSKNWKSTLTKEEKKNVIAAFDRALKGMK